MGSAGKGRGNGNEEFWEWGRYVEDLSGWGKLEKTMELERGRGWRRLGEEIRGGRGRQHRDPEVAAAAAAWGWRRAEVARDRGKGRRRSRRRARWRQVVVQWRRRRLVSFLNLP